MRSGNLKHKIIIQTSVESSNDLGEVVSEWVDFKTAPIQAVSATPD
jgi:head-tail adaptor